MTCKDCVHYERCKWNADTLRDAGLLVDFTDDDELASERCIFFKNKANFVELPCEVGTLVYVLRWKRKRTNRKGGYWNSIIDTNLQMKLAKENGEILVDCKKATKSDLLKIGKTVFLTKEEAEQKLKGGADNGNL